MTRDGTLVTIDDKPALRFERRYRHPIERVWRAISDPREMAEWFPSNVEGERTVGAELLFVDEAQRAAASEAGEPTRVEGPMFHGRVVTFDPPKVFSFTWGGELLRFELLADGAETVLVFTQVLSDQSAAARNGAGWHMCLLALDRLLASTSRGGTEAKPPPERDADVPAGWEAVYSEYLDRMGPPLGVPTDDGAMAWERATHVDPERVRAVTTDANEIEAWGATESAFDPVRWDIEGVEHGTRFRVTHDAIGTDANLAATWHALLVQLDMYLAAGQLVPVEPKHWLEAYEDLLQRESAGAPSE